MQESIFDCGAIWLPIISTSGVIFFHEIQLLWSMIEKITGSKVLTCGQQNVLFNSNILVHIYNTALIRLR